MQNVYAHVSGTLLLLWLEFVTIGRKYVTQAHTDNPWHLAHTAKVGEPHLSLGDGRK